MFAGLKDHMKAWASGTALALALAGTASPAGAMDGQPGGPPHPSPGKPGPVTQVIDLPNTTQGPLWPPGELMDEDGNFIVVGLVLTEVAPGVVAPVPNSGVIVSKDTVPPLDASGKEDFTNAFGAPYQVVRALDLSPGSPDLDMPIYTNSLGPATGDFGGGPRVPRAGESAYNLNPLQVCRDLFPAQSQTGFERPSVPLNESPIWGFQGDQVAYNPDTGEAYDPHLGSGSQCPPEGCPGENRVDHRSVDRPITLGDHLRGKAQLKITLTQYEPSLGAYTHARFSFQFRDLLPNSLYAVWAFRQNAFFPGAQGRLPDPLALPNVVVTDARGNARSEYEVENPFPDPATDDAGLRIIGIAVNYHSDYQNWGACATHTAPGVEAHAVFSTLADGTFDMTSFVTQEPLE